MCKQWHHDGTGQGNGGSPLLLQPRGDVTREVEDDARQLVVAAAGFDGGVETLCVNSADGAAVDVWGLMVIPGDRQVFRKPLQFSRLR